MKESTTYQAILQEGRNEGLIEGRNEGLIEGSIRAAQRLLLIQGEIRFGTPGKRTRQAIETIRDLEHLERLSRRVVDPSIHDWASLLGTT